VSTITSGDFKSPTPILTGETEPSPEHQTPELSPSPHCTTGALRQDPGIGCDTSSYPPKEAEGT
jgi:hypothetical protein